MWHRYLIVILYILCATPKRRLSSLCMFSERWTHHFITIYRMKTSQWPDSSLLLLLLSGSFQTLPSSDSLSFLLWLKTFLIFFFFQIHNKYAPLSSHNIHKLNFLSVEKQLWSRNKNFCVTVGGKCRLFLKPVWFSQWCLPLCQEWGLLLLTA